MTKEEFEQRLLLSTEKVMAATEKLIVEPLVPTCRYLIAPSQSYDGNPLRDDMEIFPGDSLPRNQYIGPIEVGGVLNYLWRHGKVPEWIDISVKKTDSKFTSILLRCCGRYTSLEAFSCAESRQRISASSVSEIIPFSLRLPSFPRNWRIVEKGIPNLQKSVEINGRFSLYHNQDF